MLASCGLLLLVVAGWQPWLMGGFTYTSLWTSYAMATAILDQLGSLDLGGLTLDPHYPRSNTPILDPSGYGPYTPILWRVGI